MHSSIIFGTGFNVGLTWFQDEYSGLIHVDLQNAVEEVRVRCQFHSLGGFRLVQTGKDVFGHVGSNIL